MEPDPFDPVVLRIGEPPFTFQWEVVRNMAAMAIPGGRKRRDPFNPKNLKKKGAIRGPKVTPRLPPARKREIAVAFFS